MRERTVHHGMSLLFASSVEAKSIQLHIQISLYKNISLSGLRLSSFYHQPQPQVRNPSSSLPTPSGAKKATSTAGIANSGRSFVLRIPPPRRDSTSRRASRQSRPSLKTEAQPRDKIFSAHHNGRRSVPDPDAVTPARRTNALRSSFSPGHAPASVRRDANAAHAGNNLVSSRGLLAWCDAGRTDGAAAVPGGACAQDARHDDRVVLLPQEQELPRHAGRHTRGLPHGSQDGFLELPGLVA
jgi:hypothetical protein